MRQNNKNSNRDITLQDMGSEYNRRLFPDRNAEKLTGSQDFTYQTFYACERERETEPHSDTVKQRRNGRILDA